MSVAKDLLFEQMEQESREQTPEELFEDALTRPEPDLTPPKEPRCRLIPSCRQRSNSSRRRT